MDVAELMVGDLIRQKSYPYALHIKAIRDDKSVLLKESFGRDGLIYEQTSVIYDESHVEPIPLTKEILEQNGFEEQTISGIIADRLGSTRKMLLKLSDDDEYIAEINGFFEIKKVNEKLRVLPIRFVGNLEYVHQLQQVLRLIGLKEMAENFKV